MSSKKATCLACAKPFGKEVSIQCVVCGLWIHHKPCSQVSDEGLKYLEEMHKNTGSAYWACRACTAYSQGITKRMNMIEKDLDAIKGDVKQNTEGVRKAESSIEVMRKEMEKNKKEMEETLKASERRMMGEWREREIRRKNLVLHRVEEMTGGATATAEDRRTADMEKMRQILDTVGLINLVDEIKVCRRIGERGEGERPLLVVMKTEEAKKKILERASQLQGTDLEDIGIVPDLTNLQRKEEEELRVEAERRNESELTEEDKSKNLQWVVVGARGEKRLIKTVERGRGGWRGRGRGATRGRAYQRGRTRGSENRASKRGRETTEEEEVEMDDQENPAKR